MCAIITIAYTLCKNTWFRSICQSVRHTCIALYSTWWKIYRILCDMFRIGIKSKAVRFLSDCDAIFEKKIQYGFQFNSFDLSIKWFSEKLWSFQWILVKKPKISYNSGKSQAMCVVSGFPNWIENVFIYVLDTILVL